MDELPFDRKEWYQKIYLLSEHWKQTRDAILELRNYQCEECGLQAKHLHANGVKLAGYFFPTLHVHHFHYNSLFHETPEELQVLCEQCHKTAHRKQEIAGETQ